MILQATEACGKPALVIPHASGTHAQAVSESAALMETLGSEPAIFPLKPWTGHTIGASGLLETAIISSRLKLGPSAATPSELNLPPASTVFKIASAMGGKHSLIALQSPS